MSELVPVGLRPPKITGDVTIARYLDSFGSRDRWRVSVADCIHFLTDHSTAQRIHALAAAGSDESTYADVYSIYEHGMGGAAEPMQAFVRWCETHRHRLEQLAETPDTHVLSFRWSLFSAPTCARVGRIFEWLFDPFTMVIFTSIALLALPTSILLHWTSSQGASISGAAIIALLGVLFHEFGHITACVRYHAKQGGIGVGLYWIWPVFFADVRGSWTLTARERLQVSAGGLYFQLIYAALLAIVGMATGSATITLAIYMTMLLMGNTLNPILKYDGYWILSDWLNVANLHTQISMHLKALCQINCVGWAPLVRSRMTLVAIAFAAFALSFAWIVFRALIPAGTSALTELFTSTRYLYHLFSAGSFTQMELAVALMKEGYILLQLAFIAMGLMMFGIRSVRAVLSVATTSLGRG